MGRTGTVVGCLLVDAGLGADAIDARLAELRAGTTKADRHCPETADQRAVIERRARRQASSGQEPATDGEEAVAGRLS